MAEDRTLSTLFKDVVWPLTWRSTVIAATMGIGALAMIKYLRDDSKKPPDQQPPAGTPSQNP